LRGIQFGQLLPQQILLLSRQFGCAEIDGQLFAFGVGNTSPSARWSIHFAAFVIDWRQSSFSVLAAQFRQFETAAKRSALFPASHAMRIEFFAGPIPLVRDWIRRQFAVSLFPMFEDSSVNPL